VAQIEVEGSEASVALVGEGRLLDLCDGHTPRVPLDFACRSAWCATCVVEVIDGHEHLCPPGEGERDTLARFGHHEPSRRLGCQLVVAAGGRVRLRIVPP